MAVAVERFLPTSLPAWMTAHAFGCLIPAMAHRCVSLVLRRSLAALRAAYGHHVVGGRARNENAAHLRAGQIACAAACSTADWHGVADLAWTSFPVRNRDQGAMTAERPEDGSPSD